MKYRDLLKNRKYCLTASALIISGLLVSCGPLDSSSRAATNGLSAGDGAYMASAKGYDGAYADEEAVVSTATEADIVKEGMMVARTACIEADVLDIAVFESALTKEVEDLGGYFVSSSVDNYDSEYSTDRYARYEIKVPADKLDFFLNTIDGESNITSRSVNAEDVSLEYVDTNVRIDALNNEKKNLMRLMDDATEVSDLIEIEQRLSDIDYELQSKEQQKRALEGRVTYSSVSVTAHEERNVEHPIRKAFEVNFKDRLLDGIGYAAETFVSIVVAIPAVIIITSFVIFFIWVLSKIIRKIFKKNGMVIRYAIVPVGEEVGGGTKKETGLMGKMSCEEDDGK